MSTTLDSRVHGMVYGEGAFARNEDGDDREFYAEPRLVDHLDARARGAVEHVVSCLVAEREPAVLDLMASWDSHLPAGIAPGRVVGLGLNPVELERNTRLSERVVQDLNRTPRLPFEDAAFDVVLNTASVDYLTRPFEVFPEVGRVLRPGGLFLVAFSNRMFPEKAVAVWKRSSEAERVLVVEDYFAAAGCFGPTGVFVSQGRPRPEGDRYSHLGLPSDPVYAVWAERSGGPERPTPRRVSALEVEAPWDRAEVERRQVDVGSTHRCPHCGDRLCRWAVPQTPFTEWDQAYFEVCFNDRCPLLQRGFDAMNRQGNRGFSHRFMYDPGRGACSTIPVPTLKALRDGIEGE